MIHWNTEEEEQAIALQAWMFGPLAHQPEDGSCLPAGGHLLSPFHQQSSDPSRNRG